MIAIPLTSAVLYTSEGRLFCTFFRNVFWYLSFVCNKHFPVDKSIGAGYQLEATAAIEFGWDSYSLPMNVNPSWRQM